jgi:hypothetical protein
MRITPTDLGHDTFDLDGMLLVIDADAAVMCVPGVGEADEADRYCDASDHFLRS